MNSNVIYNYLDDIIQQLKRVADAMELGVVVKKPPPPPPPPPTYCTWTYAHKRDGAWRMATSCNHLFLFHDNSNPDSTFCHHCGKIIARTYNES